MQSLPPAATLAHYGRQQSNPRRKPRLARSVPFDLGASIGTAAVALYLFVVHSYKLPLGTTAILGGLFAVFLMVRPLRACTPIYFYAAFLAWSLVTLPAAMDPALGWTAWVEVFKIFLIGCLVFNAIRTRGQHRFITLVWLGLFAVYPVRGTLFNFLTGNGAFGRFGWNFAFANFNDMATFTLFPLAMSIERLRSTDKLWVKACAFAGVITLPFIILITQSRAGMMGLGVMFFFLFFSTKYKLRLGASVVGIALIAVLFAPQSVWDRIRGMQYLTSVETLGQSDSSAEQRYTIWQVARNIIYNNPAIGVGIGNYPIAHEQYARKKQEWSFARGNRDTHSTYLRLMAEIGPIGTFLYLMVFISCFRELQKKARSTANGTSPYEKMVRDRCRTYQAALLGISICAIFGSYETVAFPFLAAMLMAATLRLQDESLGAPDGQSLRYLERFAGPSNGARVR